MTGLLKHNSNIHNIFVDNRSRKYIGQIDDYLNKSNLL